jgi:hypothetical protein
LTDPQAAWVARPGVDPFFAYDANYLIDNKEVLPPHACAAGSSRSS